jgi:hypothetical protein
MQSNANSFFYKVLLSVQDLKHRTNVYKTYEICKVPLKLKADGR